LADRLITAIEANRQLLDESRIANGEPGRVEIHVNPALNRIVVQVLIPDQQRVA
jgi:hypothetical protein